MEKRAKILLIDDDVDFIDINKAVLENNNYEVVVAFDGEEGIRRAKEEKPDLIVLDVMMRTKKEGFEVSRVLRKDPTLKETPILMLTAIHQEGYPWRYEPDETWLPVDVFLDKPVKPERLVEEIGKMLERKAEKK